MTGTPSSSELAAAPPRRQSRLRATLWRIVPPLAFFVLFVGLLYLVSYVLLSPQRQFLPPPPHDVVKNGLLDGRNLHEQLRALWDTGKVALIGLAIAFVIGTSLAILMSQAKWIERSLYPYAVIVQVTPILAVVPLIALWFGYDIQARVVVCVLISIFPIITNTLHGLVTVDSNLHDLFTLHHARRSARLVKLQLPHAIPDIFVGLRVSAGLSVIGAIVGEISAGFGTQSFGLGYLITAATGKLNTAYAFAAVICSTLLSLAIFATVSSIGAVILARWHIAAPRSSTTNP